MNMYNLNRCFWEWLTEEKLNRKKNLQNTWEKLVLIIDVFKKRWHPFTMLFNLTLVPLIATIAVPFHTHSAQICLNPSLSFSLGFTYDSLQNNCKSYKIGETFHGSPLVSFTSVASIIIYLEKCVCV